MSDKKEEWKLIDFQGKKPNVQYAVSNQGRFGVMDSNGHIDVRTFKPQDGGYRYNFKIAGKSMALFVYKEVAKAFLKKPSPKHTFIIRKDHNYLNNKLSNLKWATPEEHKQHVTFSPKSVKARKKRAITKSYTAKVFNEKTVREVKKLIWDPKRKLTFKQIAEKYKVSEMQIYRIKTGELWYHVHVDNEPINKKYKDNLNNIALQEKESERKKNKEKKREKKQRKKRERLRKKEKQQHKKEKSKKHKKKKKH